MFKGIGLVWGNLTVLPVSYISFAAGCVVRKDATVEHGLKECNFVHTLTGGMMGRLATIYVIA